MGLTDSQQGYMTLISMLLVAVSVVAVPAGAPWYVALLLGIFGAVGMALKEFLGIISPTTPTNNPVIGNPSPSTPTPPASSSASTAPTGTLPVVVLPPLPQGFSLQGAQSAGFTVYENVSGNIILTNKGQITDAFGNPLPSNTSLSGYTQL